VPLIWYFDNDLDGILIIFFILTMHNFYQNMVIYTEYLMQFS